MSPDEELVALDPITPSSRFPSKKEVAQNKRPNGLIDKNPCKETAVTMKISDDEDEDDDDDDDDGDDDAFQCYSMPSVRGISLLEICLL